jgi:hypothetical protein
MPSVAVHEQHATSIIDLTRMRLQRVEEMPRMPVVVYDTDWHDENIRNIPNSSLRSRTENARKQQPNSIQFDEAQVHHPQTILAREQHEHVERNNEESVEPIRQTIASRDHSTERIEVASELMTARAINQAMMNDDQGNESMLDITSTSEHPILFERSMASTSVTADCHYQKAHRSPELILCHPIDNHLENSSEQVDAFADDSLLIRHQQNMNVQSDAISILEKPLTSTTTLTLNFPQQTQDVNLPWQRVFDQRLSEPQTYERLHLQTQQPSPRYLPSIASPAHEHTLNQTGTIANEFHQTTALHENVHIGQSNVLPLLSSTNVQHSQPVYRVRQEQMLNDEYISTSSLHVEQPDVTRADQRTIEPVTIQAPVIPTDVDVRVRPAYAETLSLVNIESFSNRFAERLEHEQHLALVDQISLSYTTTFRSTLDETQRAIERYEAKHPFSTRSLPFDSTLSTVLPHDEQLAEETIVKSNLDRIQQQVELRTNTKCANTFAIAAINDAYYTGERFEEEKSMSISHSDQQHRHMLMSTVVASHCSPTSDYETDSLDKDNDIPSSTTSIDGDPIVVTMSTLPVTIHCDQRFVVPVNNTLDIFVVEQQNQCTLNNDFLANNDVYSHEIMTNENHQLDSHRANEYELEIDERSSTFATNNEQQLLSTISESMYLHLPIINELSIYQTSSQHDCSVDTSPHTTLKSVIHTESITCLNSYETNRSNILSMAVIHDSPDDNDQQQLTNIANHSHSTICLDQCHAQSACSSTHTPLVHTQSFPVMFSEITEQTPIIDCITDELSTASLLPDVNPVAVHFEVTHWHVNDRKQ